ncbi:MAG: alpha/beta fold hydrolase [Acidimicrobiia bacterium]
MARLVFLPGTSGRGRDFWAPVASELPDHDHVFVDYPGLGGTPSSIDVDSYDDLVDMVIGVLGDVPSVLVAQSMGGYVAVQVALRASALVAQLVLAATSGGVDARRLGVADWRPGSRAAHPDAPAWVYAPAADLSSRLGEIRQPTLLVWATDDAISPRAVGAELQRLLPRARLVTYGCDDHWVAHLHAAEVAREIEALLSE